MNRFWFFVLVLGLLVGCADAQQMEMASEPAWGADQVEFVTSETMGLAPAPPAQQVADQVPVAQERLIIRTGQMSVVVLDTEVALAEITLLAEATGGWVVSSNVYQFNERGKRGSITVRVPAEQFDEMVAGVKETAVATTRESTESQDVTEEYVDLSARLNNLQATADRVRAFLDEAQNVEEALEVNRSLSQLEEQIEVIQGRINYLSQSAAYSTLTIDITPDALSQPLAVGGWEPQGTARTAIEALVVALQGVVNLAIWALLFLLPLGLLIVVPFWLLIRTIRRRRAAA